MNENLNKQINKDVNKQKLLIKFDSGKFLQIQLKSADFQVGNNARMLNNSNTNV